MSPVSFLTSRTRLAAEGIGKPVLRKEDARLLTGGGCYSDDVNLPGQAYTCFVRSPHAHARITRVDATAALATPGVIAVLTGRDAAADGVRPLTHSPMPGNPYEDIIRQADVLVLCGDFTDYGLPDEARVLARELTASMKLPVVDRKSVV